jgi:hypothetical protein
MRPFWRELIHLFLKGKRSFRIGSLDRLGRKVCMISRIDVEISGGDRLEGSAPFLNGSFQKSRDVGKAPSFSGDE